MLVIMYDNLELTTFPWVEGGGQECGDGWMSVSCDICHPN